MVFINKILKNQKNSISKIVSQISNIVSVTDSANLSLFVNSSPIVITFGDLELKDILSISSSLVCNIGTLKNEKIFINACLMANNYNVPIVLDPVGVGASKLRFSTVKKILLYNPQIIRGNYSEIKNICKIKSLGKSIDSQENSISKEEIEQMCKYSKKANQVIIATGKIDYIIFENNVTYINVSVIELSKLTGMGCCLSTLVGCFVSKNSNFYKASISAVVFFKYCAYIIKDKKNIYSFKTEFFNNIYKIKKIDSPFLKKIISFST